MRNLCLAVFFAFLQVPTLVSAAEPDTVKPVVAESQDTAKAVPATSDSSTAAAPKAAEAPVPDTTIRSTPATAPDGTSLAMAPVAAPQPSSRALFPDYGLVSQQYAFGIVAQAVAGALGFFIGSGLETAIVGEEEAHQGTLSFTGIRYDNFSGAFWGASIGGFMGSSLAVYFTGQSNEADGGYFWTLFGTALAGSGALYLADLMGVEEEADWKPFIPLLAIPSAGGIVGFSVSRWFSDRKRESIMGPDAGIQLHPPRLAMALTPEGERFQLQALNLSF